MKKIYLEDEKRVSINNVNSKDSIFVKKDGKLVGMVTVVNGGENYGWCTVVNGDWPIHKPKPSPHKCIEEGHKLGYEYFIIENGDY